jgi:hypothetical protein
LKAQTDVILPQFGQFIRLLDIMQSFTLYRCTRGE